MIVSYGYSIPDDLLNNTENRSIIKCFKDAPLIPGKQETYIYDNEDDYNTMYQRSKFAITKKKYGWDCLRHYEILGNKCVPLFENLENCPENTMKLLPKKLLLELRNNKNTMLEEQYQQYLNV